MHPLMALNAFKAPLAFGVPIPISNQRLSSQRMRFDLETKALYI